jgi:hypothetical protein
VDRSTDSAMPLLRKRSSCSSPLDFFDAKVERTGAMRINQEGGHAGRSPAPPVAVDPAKPPPIIARSVYFM